MNILRRDDGEALEGSILKRIGSAVLSLADLPVRRKQSLPTRIIKGTSEMLNRTWQSPILRVGLIAFAALGFIVVTFTLLSRFLREKD